MDDSGWKWITLVENVMKNGWEIDEKRIQKNGNDWEKVKMDINNWKYKK